MSQKTRWLLVAITLLAFWLRLPGLFANSFQGDEALFATWARLIAVWQDPLLQTQLVDKPPLLFYLQALFYPLQGPVEWAARLPNWIASILLIPLTAQWVWRWYGGRQTADDGRWTMGGARTWFSFFGSPSLWVSQPILVAVLLALSPYAIQFSSTAFLDPLLLFWLVGSLALLDRPGWSGVLFGLALLTKHQAWLFLPLLLAVGWWRWSEGRAFARWLAGMLPSLAALLLWEWLRTGSLVLWSLQVSNFGGTRLIWSWELWPRLLAWAELGQMVWAGGRPGLLLFLLIIVGSGWLWWRGHPLDRWLILFSGGYLLTHWLLAIPVWDRYLLLLVPIFSLLLARFVFYIPATAYKWGLVMGLALLLAVGGWNGRYAHFPIGGQTEADHGIGELVGHLEEAPYGTVLYDHYHSWQWRYHLFDKRVHLSWLPHPAHLTEELLVFGQDGHARYLALPTGPAGLPLRRAVTEANFCLTLIDQTEAIALQLIQPCP